MVKEKEKEKEKEKAGACYDLRSRKPKAAGSPGSSLRSSKAPATPVGRTKLKKKSRPTKVSKSCRKKSPMEDPEDGGFKPKDDFLKVIARDDPELAAEQEARSLSYANLAIGYLEKEGSSYELMAPGRTFGASTSLGLVFHFNFEARKKLNPKAPVETFFGQLRHFGVNWKDSVVDCCKSLGRSDKLPDPYSRDVYIGGCRYCRRSGIHHPKSGCKRLLLGCANDDVSWFDLGKSRRI